MDKQALAGLKKLRENMTKTWGDAVTRREKVITEWETIPTGSATLDVATGIGGWPVGRISLAWGQEGVGKTTMCLQAMTQAQKKYPNKLVGYIDMEQTFSFPWAESHGVDTSDERLLHVFPENSEDVSDQIKMMITSGLFSLIIVDSIGGMESKKAFEKTAEESNMGKNAQIITRMTKQLAVSARKYNVAVILISQVRADFKSHTGFDTFAGPKGMKHGTTMNVKFSRTATPPLTIKEGNDVVAVGIEIKGKVERNKLATAGKTGTFVIINTPTEKYGPVGLDTADEIRALIDLHGLLPKRGSWYDLPDGDAVNGKDALKAWLRDNPEQMEVYRQKAIDTQAHTVVSEEVVEFEMEGAESD